MTYMAEKTCHNEKRKSFNSSILVRLLYKRACPAGHNKYRVVDAEPNGIIPPPPRRAMGPDRNCRQLNCPVPIAHRGGGSAEVALEAAFSYNPHVLADTTKHETLARFEEWSYLFNFFSFFQ